MHEMSIVSSMLSIIRQEMANHGVTRLHCAHIKYGRMTNIMPEALEFAWQALTDDSDLAGARLTHEQVPLVLRCFSCQREFEPEAKLAIAPCPHCGEELGHTIVSGRELYVDNIEAE